MPFDSQKQRRFMYSQHPEIAKRWTAEAKAAHRPAVQAADLDLLTDKIAGRMGGAPQLTPKDEYRAQVAEHMRRKRVTYADPPSANLDFNSALAANGMQAPVQSIPPVRGSADDLAARIDQANDLAASRLSTLTPEQKALNVAQQQAAIQSSLGGIAAPRKVQPAAPKALAPGEIAIGATAPQSLGAGMPAISLPMGGGGPVKTSWVPTVAPDVLKDTLDAQAQQREAANAMRNANAHEAEDQGVTAALQAERYRQDAAAMRQQNEDRYGEKGEITRREQALDALSQEVADKKVEPFHPKTGDRIRYALMGALGGFMQGFRGMQNNPGLQQMQREIDQYYANQREEIERKKGRIGDMQGLLASAYRRFGNLDQAEAAARAVTYQQLDAEQRAHAAQTNSEKALAASDMFSADLQARQAAERARLSRQVVTGGGGISAASIQTRARKLYDDAIAGNRPVSWEQALGEAAHEAGLGGGGSTADIFGKTPGGGKSESTAAALQGTLNALPAGAGEDVYDRTAPSWLRSSKSLSESANLAGASRAYLKAIGARPPPAGKEGDEDAIRTAIGRPDKESVAAFRKRAAAVVAQKQNAGVGGGEAGSETTDDFESSEE